MYIYVSILTGKVTVTDRFDVGKCRANNLNYLNYLLGIYIYYNIRYNVIR